MRVLIVVTYRPTDMAVAKHPFLQVQRHLAAKQAGEELALEFLHPADVDRYLTLLFPGHRLPTEFAALVHQKTEGSPLFMADWSGYLRDRGVIAQREGVWGLARAVPDIARDLPETVKSTISRKIDQLDEADRRLMLVASVQGYEFDAAVLSDVLSSTPPTQRTGSPRWREPERADPPRRNEGVPRPHADGALPLCPRALSERPVRDIAANTPQRA